MLVRLLVNDRHERSVVVGSHADYFEEVFS